MAHTKFVLKTKAVLAEDLREEIKAALEPIAAKHNLILRCAWRNPSTSIRIIHDPHPANPRDEYDHIGLMYCQHSRYQLGDKGAHDPTGMYCTVCDVHEADCQCEHQYTDDDSDPDPDVTFFVDNMLKPHPASTMKDGKRVFIIDGKTYPILSHSGDRYTERFNPDIAIALPLYLYDHSGLAISHGAFDCPWDSGGVGWHYMMDKAAQENWPDATPEERLALARQCLTAELKEYDAYLRGNVWGFQVINEDGDVTDSCWGFFGEDLADTGIADHFTAEQQEAVKLAWEARWESRG